MLQSPVRAGGLPPPAPAEQLITLLNQAEDSPATRQAVRGLLHHKLDFGRPSIRGYLPLCRAARSPAFTRLLLADDRFLSAIDTREPLGLTAMQRAIQLGQPIVIDLLYKAGAALPEFASPDHAKLDALIRNAQKQGLRLAHPLHA